MPLITVRQGLEIGFALFSIIGGWMVLHHYFNRVDKDGKTMGIGLRAIQMTTAVLAAPVVLILSLEGTISQEATGILLGTIIGFILSPKA